MIVSVDLFHLKFPQEISTEMAPLPKPLCNTNIYDYIRPESGFNWDSVSTKFWQIQSFDEASAHPWADNAETLGKPNTYAAYYLNLSADSGGEPLFELTRSANCQTGDGVRWLELTCNVDSSAAYTIGSWNKLQFRLKLNTPGSSDGIFQAWLDDDLISTHTDVNYQGEKIGGCDDGWNLINFQRYGSGSGLSGSVFRDDFLLESYRGHTNRGVTIN